MNTIESGSVGIAAITKFGWIKFATLGSALLGAGLMALSRPPQSRREMFYQGATALGTSFIFGDFAVRWAATFFSFINLITDSSYDVLTFYVAVHGLLGALAWGLFGSIGAWRDKLRTDPIEAIKDVKSLV